jgi:uncharacterized membrane protein
MKTNESGLDRIIRGVIGIIILTLSLTGSVTGVWGIVLDVLGAVLLITAAIGFCPLYALLKIKTNKA